MKTILVFAGSTSSTSINKQLIEYATSFLTDFEVVWIDLNDFEMPIYSEDRETEDGIPTEAVLFIDKIRQAHGIVLSLAEHNSNFTTAFKNTLDWSSRAQKEFFQHRPMLLMSTSTGGFAAGNAMALGQKIFPKFGGNIVSSFSLPSFTANFDGKKGITDEALKSELLEKIDEFKHYLLNS
jgi:NAD(P)H-dependent FMN reductase